MKLNRRFFLTRAGRRDLVIFISYRRRFDHASARLLRQELEKAFGEGAVFRDVDDIAPGEAFPETIRKAIESCDVFLVLISPGWVETVPSLQDPADFVRREIAAAVKRGAVLLPVLVGEAAMPKPSDLPEDIRPLAFTQATELSDARWDYDTQLLINAILKRARPTMPQAAARGSSFRRVAVAAVALLVLLVLAALAYYVRYFIPPDYAACLRRLDERAARAASSVEYGTEGVVVGSFEDYQQALRSGPEGFPLIVKLTEAGHDTGAVFVRYYPNEGGKPFFKVQEIIQPPCAGVVLSHKNADRPGADINTLQNWDRLLVNFGARKYLLRLGDHGDGFRASLLPAQ